MSDHTILLVDFPPPSLSAAALSVIDTTPTPQSSATSKETIIMARTTTATTTNSSSSSRPTYYEREDSLNNSVNLTRYNVAQNSVPLPQETGDDESDVIIWDDPQEPLLHGGDAESDVIIWDDPDYDNGKVDQQESTQHQLPCQCHQHDYDYDKKETKSTSSSISISSANVNDDDDDDEDHDHEESYRRLTIRDGIQIKVIDGGDVYVCRPSLTSKDLLFVDFGCARDSFCSSVHSSASSSSSLSASVHRSSSSSCHEKDALPQEKNHGTTTPKQTKSVQFAPIPQIHAVESFLNSGVWYTESDLDVFQRQKEKDIAMIKVLQRFSSGSRRGSMDSFSSCNNNGNTSGSGSRRASVESNPSSRRGSVESSSVDNSNYNNNYDPMADYAKMRLEKANTTPIGLENHVCSKMAIGEMNQRRVEHCRAVLGEQKRQRSLVVVQPQQQEKRRGGMIKTFFKTSNTTTSNTATATTATNKHDVDQQVERIAEISSTYSELSRKRAEVNGTLHAENDCCKIIRAGHQMSRGVSARSLSARRLSIGEVSGGPSLPTPPSA